MTADAPDAVNVTALARTIDALAPVTPGVSPYCSGADWVLGAAKALHPGRTLITAEHSGHVFVGAMDVHDPRRPCLQSVEVDWGFASPVVGPSVRIGAELTAAALVATKPSWALAVLKGLSAEHSSAIAAELEGRLRTSCRVAISCSVASLEGGYEGFLSRRSPKMRTNLRRDGRRIAAAGLEIELVDGTTSAEAVLQRAASVAARSWKAAAAPDMLSTPPYSTFYQQVLGRASAEGRLRAAFATRDGRDEAFVFGAVLGATYRGFQLGFSEEVEPLGVTNQVQLALIERLCHDGVEQYDLGMDMDYKRRWAERLVPLYLLVAHV